METTAVPAIQDREGQGKEAYRRKKNGVMTCHVTAHHTSRTLEYGIPGFKLNCSELVA